MDRYEIELAVCNGLNGKFIGLLTLYVDGVNEKMAIEVAEIQAAAMLTTPYFVTVNGTKIVD